MSASRLRIPEVVSGIVGGNGGDDGGDDGGDGGAVHMVLVRPPPVFEDQVVTPACHLQLRCVRQSKQQPRAPLPSHQLPHPACVSYVDLVSDDP